MGFIGIYWDLSGKCGNIVGFIRIYPLVNCYITMENHHVIAG